MDPKILLVDDDPNILAGYKRSLRKKFQIETALGGSDGLKAMASNGSWAVVVSDMRMPEMNGIEFLAKVKEKSPDTVRVMLTGNADQQTAMQAINEGNIFRFLTKPCSVENFEKVMAASLEQYRLIISEREILEKTLSGSINVLTDILSLYDQNLFGRTTKLRDMIRELAASMKIPSSWEFEIAALLSSIGYLGIPPEVMVKARNGQQTSLKEREILSQVPEVGAHLLARIPRLESVSNIVLYQDKCFDGSGFPNNSVAGTKIPLGSRILKVLSDLIELESEGGTRVKAIKQLQVRRGWYDPQVMKKVSSLFLDEEKEAMEDSEPSLFLPLKELRPGQIILSDIKAENGLLLLAAGHEISMIQLARLRNHAKLQMIQEPIEIKCKPGKTG